MIQNEDVRIDIPSDIHNNQYEKVICYEPDRSDYSGQSIWRSGKYAIYRFFKVVTDLIVKSK